jgi:hypothetical protein
MFYDDVKEPSNLKAKGLEYLKANNKIKKKYVLSALDLSLINLDIEGFEMYNYYTIINPLMNINESLRVIEKTIDIIEPFKSTLSVGDKIEDIKTYQIKVNKANKSIDSLKFKLEYAQNKLNDTDSRIEEAYRQIEDIKYNTNSYYMFDIRNKTLEAYKQDLSLGDVTVMQSFDLDLTNNIGYFAQLKTGTEGDIRLSKINLVNNTILGTMDLLNFGHAVNMCIEEVALDTYIWIECFPIADSKGNLFGTQIGRFKFVNGVSYQDNPPQVFDLLPGHKNTYPAIDKLNNKLAIKSTLKGVPYYSIFDLESVINSNDDNLPILLNQFKIPYGVNELSFQGLDIKGEYIYNYEGEATKEKYQTYIDPITKLEVTELVNTIPSVAYVTVLNLKGFIQYRQLVSGFENMVYREAENIKIKQLDANTYNMFLGFASGVTGSRKANVLKYTDII